MPCLILKAFQDIEQTHNNSYYFDNQYALPIPNLFDNKEKRQQKDISDYV